MEYAQRIYKAGERIRLDPDGALEVLAGVVALTAIHEDGAEVLLGFCGPGEVLPGHPEEAGGFQIHAHSEARVRVLPWAEAVQQAGFADRLRDRLRTMEAWAAVRALPSLERRLLGVLHLLSRQFGRQTGRGWMIGILITQSQLALAVGGTRSTVSRLLGRLRRRGLLIALRSGRVERYGLPFPEIGRQRSPDVQIRTDPRCPPS